MRTPPACAIHHAAIFKRGGVERLVDFDSLIKAGWDRRRDDISQASITLPSWCCPDMEGVSTVEHELHLYRGDNRVWQGPITRLEFDRDEIQIAAEDILWVAKRRAFEKGWNYGSTPQNYTTAVRLAQRILRDECYARFGDDWGMMNNVIARIDANDTEIRSVVNAWQSTCWLLVDDLAHYQGLDYTVVNRRIYLNDVHMDWRRIQPLTEEHIGGPLRIVEYGNQFADRYVRTDGSGAAAVAVAPAAIQTRFGRMVDYFVNSTAQDDEVPDRLPSAETLSRWQQYATRALPDHYPPPTSVNVPDNSTLTPECPWDIDNLAPGSTFFARVELPCRKGESLHKLQTVRVREDGETGETVEISTVNAPSYMFTP